MNLLDKHIDFVTITVEHEYFDGLIPVDLFIEEPLVRKKYNLWGKRIQNVWTFYGPEIKKEDFLNEFQKVTIKLLPLIEGRIKKCTVQESSEERNEFEEDEKAKKQRSIALDFVIKPTNALFHYVTSDINYVPTEQTHINVKINAVSKHYEYILFPKNIQGKDQIEIMDSNKLVEFEAPQFAFWENGEEVIRLLSKKQIKLSRKSKSRFVLIERSVYGERILLNELKIPQPGSLSVYSPREAITAFYTV